MNLYLVRHAVAEDRDPRRWPDDATRPLTARGERRFRRAARGLGRIAPEVESVLASPYLRAWRTAEILARETAWPAPEASRALEAPRAPEDALGALREQAPQRSLALVGHEPGLSRLASLLLTGDSERTSLELKKGAVILLDCRRDLLPGAAVLRWSLSPRVLRALAADPRAAGG